MKSRIFQDIVKVELSDFEIEIETLGKVQEYSATIFSDTSAVLRSIMGTFFIILNIISLSRYGKRFIYLCDQRQHDLWFSLNSLIGFAQIRMFVRTTSLLRLVEVGFQ